MLWLGVLKGGKMMKSNEAMLDLRAAARQSLAVMMAFLMVVFTQMQVNGQDSYAPLGAEQLNQLVAPIALYPDSLVAQVLTASTYPQQITDANNFVRQSSGMPPEQLAAAADGQPWDPSVKALTAFPSVLDNLARNIGWTSALGNAYYNQPGDVMNAIQAMRFQARRAGNLRSSSQLRVYSEGPQIVIAPVDPAYVYVPYYNPWAVYGAPLPVYAGYYYAPPPRGLIYAGIFGFAAVAIGVGIWGHYNWGWHAWSPNWGGGNVYYNHNTYISNSTTVINRGNFGSFNRGVYERPGAGVPPNFRPPVTGGAAGFRGGSPVPANRLGGNPNFNRPANEGRPAQGGQYQQPQARPAQGGQYQQPQARPEYRAPAATPEVARPQVQPQARPDYRAPAARPEVARPQVQPQARPEYRAPAARPEVARPQVQQQAPRPEGRQQPHPPAAERRAAPPKEAPEKK